MRIHGFPHGARRAGHDHDFFPDGPFRPDGPQRGTPQHPGGGPHPRPHRGGHPPRGGRRGRAQRGDVRAAVLMLLTDEPMHGYQLMQAIAERTGGAWRPSPGAIYPTIAQLEDEGLVVVDKNGGRKLVSLTDEGRALVEDPENVPTDPFEGHTREAETPDLRAALHGLQHAARSVAATGTDADVTAAHKVLTDAKKALYRILAEDDGTTASPESD
ncbi:PadR family transcriptional regulator [Rhodococcus sp. 7Tela_A2]|uniref:PadR family transcriptional regulator n=1 Tax=Rhodococcus sp. 7Tela_A2 TaxID=3093744 RepID=UPI003BB7935B